MKWCHWIPLYQCFVHAVIWSQVTVLKYYRQAYSCWIKWHFCELNYILCCCCWYLYCFKVDLFFLFSVSICVYFCILRSPYIWWCLLTYYVDIYRNLLDMVWILVYFFYFFCYFHLYLMQADDVLIVIVIIIIETEFWNVSTSFMATNGSVSKYGFHFYLPVSSFKTILLECKHLSTII